MTVYVVLWNSPGLPAEDKVLAVYQVRAAAEEFAETVEGGALVQAVEVET